MENIIRLPSQQSKFDVKNRLVDLVIPSNSGVYDLSQCYIAIDTTVAGIELDLTQAGDGRLPRTAGYVEATEAVANTKMGLKHQASVVSIYDDVAIPVSALVKNASMFCASKGKIEDIRRVDVLRATMNAYLKDIEDIQCDAIGGLSPQAKQNPWGSGRYAQLVGVGDTSSNYASHEIRIFLKDIFNTGAVQEYDSAKMGDTKIHLELNLDRTQLKQVLGSTPNVWDRYYHNQQVGTISYPADVKYKTAETVTIANGTASLSESSILMKAEYASLDDSPFYNNQMVKVTTTYGGTGTQASQYPTNAEERWAVIKSISWDKDTRKITLEFGGEVLASGAVTVADVTVDRDVEGMDATTQSLSNALSFETVELTAVRRTDMEQGADTIQYTQFMTQSDQFTNSSTLNRSYYLPAQTQTAFIILPSKEGSDFSDILGCARVGSYRFTLNGESVTNRAVPYMAVPTISVTQDAKTEKGSSIHYTLVGEAMMNSGIRYHSLREAVYDQDIPMSIDVPVDGSGNYGWTNLSESPMKACYMLALPVEISNGQTQLTIELDGSFPNSSGELHIFSEVRSVL